MGVNTPEIVIHPSVFDYLPGHAFNQDGKMTFRQVFYQAIQELRQLTGVQKPKLIPAPKLVHMPKVLWEDWEAFLETRSTGIGCQFGSSPYLFSVRMNPIEELNGFEGFIAEYDYKGKPTDMKRGCLWQGPSAWSGIQTRVQVALFKEPLHGRWERWDGKSQL